MIASKPVRIVSMVIVALVVVVGVRLVVGGIAFGGDLLDAPSLSPGPEDRGERTVGVVAYVLDGDTVQVDLRDGADVRVRFLGISAPEIPHPGKQGECYGQAATRHLKKLLPAGTKVTLVGDPSQDDVDVYGRWLRYVQASGRDVGAALIRSGSAEARDTSTPVSRHSKYMQSESRARHDDLGLWTACRWGKRDHDSA